MARQYGNCNDPEFTGIERWPNKAPGSQSVDARDTIGSGNCWCGEAPGHDWPGKADGAPHPR
jgi:hypothetical protein